MTSILLDAMAIRAEVDEFAQSEGGDRSAADCFPAWYLKHTFGVSTTIALQHSSDPAVKGKTKGDWGLDAFFLESQASGSVKLHLIQAKYYDALSAIAKGFKELEKCLPRIAAALDGVGYPEIENKVYVNLRATLQKLRKDDGARIVPDFEFTVIHLNEQDPMLVRANCRKEIDDLKEEFRTVFSDARCTVDLVGPSQVDITDRVDSVDDWFSLTLKATPLRG
ncbi:MAG: hypothetical protein EXR98_22185 [Gemmataceae bacterium]|nr:hypothetical protein [Gemmataceae bacterium]